jgi:glycerophosphoryl diester phosphodiesterase
MGFLQHQFGDCLMIGHRGAGGMAPENTLSSFAMAVQQGVDGIELDIHWAHDTLWVIHDDTLNRTTNAKGTLSDHTADALRQFDAGNGDRIPTLAEVFAATPPHVGINIELKGTGCVAPLAALLREQGDRDVLVSSFRHHELADFHRLAPQIAVGPLFSRWQRDAWDIASQLQAWSVHLAARLVTRPRVDTAHAKGLRLLTYTVNSPAAAKRLMNYGVDGIFTDFPDGRLNPA